MADEKYNGWRNVETWRVQLHLTNDEQTAAQVARESRRWADEEHFLPSEVVEPFHGWLRRYVEARVLPEVGSVEDTWAQFSSDTLAAALERVDWEQVADHWINAPIPWDAVNTRGTP
jgi:hypothetical protein